MGEAEAQADRLEVELAEVCGMVNAATCRLVELIAKVLATDAWHGVGIHSAEQWVGWKCGVPATGPFAGAHGSAAG